MGLKFVLTSHHLELLYQVVSTSIEFRVNGHELRHPHGDRQADLPFPVRVREELVASRRALPHHILPETGWLRYSLSGPERIPALNVPF
jgi:luciferase-like monooxygenase